MGVGAGLRAWNSTGLRRMGGITPVSWRGMGGTAIRDGGKNSSARGRPQPPYRQHEHPKRFPASAAWFLVDLIRTNLVKSLCASNIYAHRAEHPSSGRRLSK